MKNQKSANPVAAVRSDASAYEALDTYIASLKIAGGDTAARRAVLIQVLHKAQELLGYLPEAVQKHISARLDLHVSEIYGVVSFYHFFKTKRTGQYRVDFCMGTACFVRGAAKLIEQVEKLLGVKVGETTKDGKFTLGSLRCVGACSLAPVIQINGKTYGRVAAEQIPAIFAEYN